MTPTTLHRLTEAERAHLRAYEALAEAYHAACEDATTYAEVRCADRLYRTALGALDALKGGAR